MRFSTNLGFLIKSALLNLNCVAVLDPNVLPAFFSSSDFLGWIFWEFFQFFVEDFRLAPACICKLLL